MFGTREWLSALVVGTCWHAYFMKAVISYSIHGRKVLQASCFLFHIAMNCELVVSLCRGWMLVVTQPQSHPGNSSSIMYRIETQSFLSTVNMGESVGNNFQLFQSCNFKILQIKRPREETLLPKKIIEFISNWILFCPKQTQNKTVMPPSPLI